ncbi:MAG TPA: M20 family peptidase, partial [Actinoplanes sp.]|nr:M20 family peptidase [Actinoplanes sp.]
MPDLSRLLDDAAALIAIRSTADRPDDLRRALGFMLDRLGPGFTVERFKVAALVLAEVFRRHAPGLPYPLGLQLVTDEEVGGFDGTAHQIAQGV